MTAYDLFIESFFILFYVDILQQNVTTFIMMSTKKEWHRAITISSILRNNTVSSTDHILSILHSRDLHSN